jgi:hypothetical protein
MKHRHLDTTEYTLAAIDSVLEYGDLPDWRALFAAARRDPRLAEKVLHIARHRPADGASELAIYLLRNRVDVK